MKGFAFHEIGGIMIFITFLIFFDLFVCFYRFTVFTIHLPLWLSYDSVHNFEARNAVKKIAFKNDMYKDWQQEITPFLPFIFFSHR